MSSRSPQAPESAATTAASSPAKRPAGMQYVALGALLRTSGGVAHQICTGVVVATATRNVVATAAHCVSSGAEQQLLFAPGYHSGVAPLGTWAVRSVHTDPAWQATKDPDADYAFLTTSPSPGNGTRGPVQTAAGADPIGLAPHDGDVVAVLGYPRTTAGHSLECHTEVRTTAEFPTVACPGFGDGTSGGPLLTHFDPATGGGTLVGVIGGLEAGGCTADVSYASPFTAAVHAVVAAAQSDAPSSPRPRSVAGSSC